MTDPLDVLVFKGAYFEGMNGNGKRRGREERGKGEGRVGEAKGGNDGPNWGVWMISSSSTGGWNRSTSGGGEGRGEWQGW